MSPLVTATELSEELASAAPPRVLDARWSLAAPNSYNDYLAGHIPGAAYVDLEEDVAQKSVPTEGRHPLPSAAHLQQATRRWGLRNGDRTVVYDADTSLAAARVWWVLKDAGIDVRVLDGGLAAWSTAGLPVESGDSDIQPGDISLTTGAEPRLDIDAVLAFAATDVLLDARAGERYRGETEPVDPVAGHIPGAISAPTGENVGPDGRFLTPEVLAVRFANLGVTPRRRVAVYCGSGITASHQILALELAGHTAALYPGSWSQWSNNPHLPVATGPNPEGA
jgi:thiosulfate/3-mercaptopyruvate sulfurtransferase